MKAHAILVMSLTPDFIGSWEQRELAAVKAFSRLKTKEGNKSCIKVAIALLNKDRPRRKKLWPQNERDRLTAFRAVANNRVKIGTVELQE